MKLENSGWQFCAFEYSKRLKELGVRQESLRWWRVYIKTGEAILTSDDYCKSNPGDYEYYSAFTVAELGEMLPEDIIKSWIYTLCIHKGDKIWFVSYKELRYRKSLINIAADTEVSARAKMLVYLLENKIVKSEKIKGGVK